MQIKFNHGSKGEVFCCSVKKAKEFFKNTEVYLNFGYLGKNYNAYNRETHYNFMHKIVKGKVLCLFKMRNRERNPILSFYLIKETDCNELIIKEFEKNYLPKIFEFYHANLNDDSIIEASHLLFVELIDGKLNLQQTN